MKYNTYTLHIEGGYETMCLIKETARESLSQEQCEDFYKRIMINKVNQVANDAQLISRSLLPVLRVQPPLHFNPKTSQLTLTCSEGLCKELCTQLTVKTVTTCNDKVRPLKFEL